MAVAHALQKQFVILVHFDLAEGDKSLLVNGGWHWQILSFHDKALSPIAK
jgi:hypothetical protein